MNVKNIANTTFWALVAVFNITLILIVVLALAGYEKPFGTFIEVLVAGN